MHTTVLPAEFPGEGGHRCRWVGVQMAEQAVALPGHDVGQSVPAFEGQDAFGCRVPGLGSAPGGEEGGGVVFEGAPTTILMLVILVLLSPS